MSFEVWTSERHADAVVPSGFERSPSSHAATAWARSCSRPGRAKSRATSSQKAGSEQPPALSTRWT